MRRHLPSPELLWRDIGVLGSCQDGTPEEPISGFGYDDPMLRLQTPFFTFPVHFDCYGNVLVQMSGRKRVVVFPREAVRLVDGRAVSHEIFDIADMLTPEGHAMVETAVLEPGDALF
eukprot:COSAG05_NODE_8098_length_736_cov_1.097331_1_plen_116_part_10